MDYHGAVPYHLIDEPDEAHEIEPVVSGPPRREPRPLPRLSPLHEAAIRARDVVVASLLLIILSPLFLVIGLLIKLETPGPCLFRQQRGGRGRQPFVVLKFRTMTVMEDSDDVRQVRQNDPRVTGVGRFLRRSCLDELPQLINVIRGDMALVGPRPHALAHDRRFMAVIPEYHRRFAVRPGMTGLAQVTGLRGEISEPDKLSQRLVADLTYVEKRSFWLDLKILAMTPAEILGRPGLFEMPRRSDATFDLAPTFAKIVEKEL